MAAPDGGIPHDLLHHSHCIMVIPGMKRAGIGLGGNFGRGVVTCRTGHGWSAPLFLTVGGGSFGLQLGAQETDLIMLILNAEGERYLLKDKFSLGGDMSATAGPVGRDAQANTDALMHSEMLAYSRSRGLFGGITLNGAVIKQDSSSNQKFYGDTKPERILSGHVGTPGAAGALIAEIARYAGATSSARRHSAARSQHLRPLTSNKNTFTTEATETTDTTQNLSNR
jgi:lipid-binding SYLF domain-containing protein